MPACLFHFICQNPAGSGEHILQAALGGRRRDRRLLCDDCQMLFSRQLDTVLPDQLRHMNARLGVEGDHTGTTPMPAVEDQVTGERYLVDDRLGFNSAEERCVDTGTSNDGKTTFRRYTVTGQIAQQRLLKKLRKSGLNFTTMKVTTSRYLIPRVVETPTSIGGRDGQRAVGRLALNVLGSSLPDLARDAGLEPFKRWIYKDTENADFANFANALPPDVCPTSPYDFSHRVVFGADAEGNLLARVTFFDAFEYALRFGKVAAPPASLLIVDLNPLAQRAGDGIDITRRTVEAIGFDRAELGRFVTDQNALADRAEASFARVIAVGEERAWTAIIAELLPNLNATRLLPAEERRAAIRKALSEQLQVAMNLLQSVVPLLAPIYRKEGLPLRAAFLEEALDPNEPRASETGESFARLTLAYIEALFAAKLEEGDVDAETARDLLNGVEGQRAAGAALTETVSAVFAQLGVEGV